MDVLLLLILIVYLPVCAYLGAVRGTIGVSWAFLVPWGLLYLDIQTGGGSSDDPNAALGPLFASAVGLLVCLVAQLWWRGREGS